MTWRNFVLRLTLELADIEYHYFIFNFLASLVDGRTEYAK